MVITLIVTAYLIGIIVSYCVIKKCWMAIFNSYTVFDRALNIFLNLFWPMSLPIMLLFLSASSDKPAKW